MMKRSVIYLAVFLFTLYWFFMFNESVMAFLLVLEVVSFLASFVFCLIAGSKLKISMESLMTTAEKYQQIPIRIVAENRARFVPLHFGVCLKIENTLTGERARYRSMATVRPKKKEVLTLPIVAENCGNVRVRMYRTTVYDLLLLMCRHKRAKDSVQIHILPQTHLIPVEVTRKTRDFIADADEYSEHESGDDPSETYQIREYNQQDSIHDIHWKLSAKSDSLMVKERGKPLGSAVLIWMNTLDDKSGSGLDNIEEKHRKRKRKKQALISSDALELAASISLSLFQEACVHTVAWYEPEHDRMFKKRVSKEVHIYELLNRLTLIAPCSDAAQIQTVYRDAFRGENFSTVIEIRIDGTMFINGMAAEIPKEKKHICWEKLGMTV